MAQNLEKHDLVFFDTITFFPYSVKRARAARHAQRRDTPNLSPQYYGKKRYRVTMVGSGTWFG